MPSAVRASGISDFSFLNVAVFLIAFAFVSSEGFRASESIDSTV